MFEAILVKQKFKKKANVIFENYILKNKSIIYRNEISYKCQV